MSRSRKPRICRIFSSSLAIACGLAALCAVAMPSAAQEARITKQGVSWDPDWLPTKGSIVHAPVTNPLSDDSPMFIFGSSWSPDGWDKNSHQTVGDLFKASVKNWGGGELSLNLGPGVGSGDDDPPYSELYSEIELGWGTRNGTPLGFQNLPGNDLAIYENGYPDVQDNEGKWRGGSDVFLVSLGYVENGTLKWTGYRYTVPSGFEPDAKWVSVIGGDSNWGPGPTYLTLIDASAFDLAVGVWITGVRIRNGVKDRDRVTDKSGAGWVELKAGSDSFFPFKEKNEQGELVEITTYKHPKYDLDDKYKVPAPRYDPDITVVVPLSQVTTVPEPGVVIALCSGLGAFLPFYLSGRRARRAG